MVAGWVNLLQEVLTRRNYMFFWIYDSQISGSSTDFIEDCPQGFILASGPDLPIEQVFWDGENVIIKPPQPGDNWGWDNSSNSWVEIEIIQIPTQQLNRWTNFLLGIIQTPTYEKMKTYLGKENPAEYTVLVALLNNSDIPEDVREKLLEKSLRRTKDWMKSSSTPLTSYDVGAINSLLKSELGVGWDISG